jgi:hypothetical protein
LRPFPDPFGYLRVCVGWKNNRQVFERIHTLVLEAFAGEKPDGMEACHDPDHNPRNNSLSNLRWGTHSENMDDARRHGTITRKLGESDVRTIRSLRGRLRQVDIAAMFSITQAEVSQIQLRRSYVFVE